MNIAFIGCGNVGAPLADHLQRLGHSVTLAARDVHSQAVSKARARNAALQALPQKAAVRATEVVFLATPYMANAQVVPPLAEALAGKVLIDCTNPVGPGLSHGLNSVQSGSLILLGEGMASVVHALDHGESLHAPAVMSAVLGALLSFGLWLADFDRVKGHGERHVADAAAGRRMRLWAYGHVPLYMGIASLAAGSVALADPDALNPLSAAMYRAGTWPEC